MSPFGGNAPRRKRPATDEDENGNEAKDADNDKTDSGRKRLCPSQDQSTSSAEADATSATPSTNAFLSSMTFASLQKHDIRGACDCDECGPSSLPLMVPDLILQAIQQHQKLAKQKVKRTQDRRLVRRCPATGVSLWQWTLPPDAEPLLEYGSSCHRLIWVQRLPLSATGSEGGSVVQSIGTGIVGSAAEEQSRPTLPWKPGGLYWVPCQPGKAVGWIHVASGTAAALKSPKEKDGDATQTSISNNNDRDEGPVVLMIAKIPLQEGSKESQSTPTPASPTKLTQPNDPMENESWANLIRSHCFQVLPAQMATTMNSASTATIPTLALCTPVEDEAHIATLQEAMKDG